MFGRLKMKFKIFGIPAHNSSLANDVKSVVLAFALLNVVHKPILSDVKYEDLACIIRTRIDVPNSLKRLVQVARAKARRALI